MELVQERVSQLFQAEPSVGFVRRSEGVPLLSRLSWCFLLRRGVEEYEALSLS